MLYSGFRHYDQIVKDNKKFVTFLASNAEIKSSAYAEAVKNIKKNKKKQSLALRFSREELSVLMKMKRTKKINKAVKKIVKKFKKSTGLKLQYVMLPANADEKIAKAFNKYKVIVISKTKKVSSVKGLDVAGLNGVVVVDTKSVKTKDLKKLKKSLKKSSVAGIKLSKCIPKESLVRKATESDAETTDVATDAEAVTKSAAMKMADTDAETDAEETTTATSSNTEQKPENGTETSANNSAASIAVSSFMSVAAIAAVAALLL
jgi:hypothetical protein